MEQRLNEPEPFNVIPVLLMLVIGLVSWSSIDFITNKLSSSVNETETAYDITDNPCFQDQILQEQMGGGFVQSAACTALQNQSSSLYEEEEYASFTLVLEATVEPTDEP